MGPPHGGRQTAGWASQSWVHSLASECVPRASTRTEPKPQPARHLRRRTPRAANRAALDGRRALASGRRHGGQRRRGRRWSAVAAAADRPPPEGTGRRNRARRSSPHHDGGRLSPRRLADAVAVIPAPLDESDRTASAALPSAAPHACAPPATPTTNCTGTQLSLRDRQRALSPPPALTAVAEAIVDGPPAVTLRARRRSRAS